MKTTIRFFLLWFLWSAGVSSSFADSLDIRKEVIPFPGGSPKIRYHYFEQEGQKIPHGLYETFYASGTVWQQYRFDRGKLQGKSLERNADGKKKWTGEFTQDVRTGRWTYWDRNGIKKMEATFGKDGQLLSMTRYNPVGKKVRQEWYENGQVVREKSWGKKGVFQRDPRVEEVPSFVGGNVIQKPVIEPAKNPD